MKKDTFEDVIRENKKGKYNEHLEISSTGYGYESVATPSQKDKNKRSPN